MFVYSCKRDAGMYTTHLFAGQFNMPELNIPADNPMTKDGVMLGRYLFYNPALSFDSSTSCASCHLQENGFSDKVSLSIGSNKQLGTSNSPNLTNIGMHPYYTRAGGVPSLEQQILVPIQEHNEFNTNILDISKRLKNDSTFVNLAHVAYPGRPYYFAITASIASFERTFISNFSKFDNYIKGAEQLNATEIAGMSLFFSTKTNCSSCHGGFNFTDYSFKNNGATILHQDSGRYRLTKNKADVGLFKVPTLRNIALSMPYMHDGSIPNLDLVLESYNAGGKHTAFINSPLIKPLHLTKVELVQLKAFLESLTDFDFIKNPKFKKL